ncbi:hypothetical protein BG003_002418 [Podila horticola]|nr:hypothetical protein BG003_002418 [Podila horticola]
MHPLHPVKENNPFGLWCLGCESFLSKRDDGYIVTGNMDNDEYARLELRAVTPGNADSIHSSGESVTLARPRRDDWQLFQTRA